MPIIWKDGRYQTEFCGSDNWNHLWFLILSSSYLKHSGDLETIRTLQPIIVKSMNMMLTNKGADDLMYASRPDWWDIGHLYGARAYITALTVRALQDFVYLQRRLGEQSSELAPYLSLAERMQNRLVTDLWDDEAGYLLNQLDADRQDRHYYSGSLIAGVFGLLEPDQHRTLLETAQRELLNPHIGIRNAMPPDFHELIDVYKFNGMEMGEPYYYFNGGVWPQGTIWYVLALLSANQPDLGLEALKQFLTLDGIRNSPNGQPSFYEYRMTDPNAANYGQIDKPTFLWFGGWYLYTLYHLVGVRENPWHVSFSAHGPAKWDSIAYEMILDGQRCQVISRGTGEFFEAIRWDGEPVASAVVTRPARQIELIRGEPRQPYLAASDLPISKVHYDADQATLIVNLNGLPDQRGEVSVVSPYLLLRVEDADGQPYIGRSSPVGENTFRIRVRLLPDASNQTLLFRFAER